MKGEFSDELQFRFGDEFLFGESTKGESESVDELQEIEGRSCSSENRRRESTVMSCCSGLENVLGVKVDMRMPKAFTRPHWRSNQKCACSLDNITEVREFEYGRQRLLLGFTTNIYEL